MEPVGFSIVCCSCLPGRELVSAQLSVVSFQNLYFMWVCEASEVNIWTVFAVGPNGAKNNKNNKNNNNKNKTKNNFASSGSDR